MANKPFVVSIAAAQRSFTVPMTHPTVQTLLDFFQDARDAALVIQNGILSRGTPDERWRARAVMQDAVRRGKDPCACLLRRRSNNGERPVVEQGMQALAITDNSGVQMPDSLMARRLLDTEHDAFSFLQWLPCAPGSEAAANRAIGLRARLSRELKITTGHDFSVEVSPINVGTFRCNLDAWLEEKGLPRLADMRPAMVPRGFIGHRSDKMPWVGMEWVLIVFVFSLSPQFLSYPILSYPIPSCTSLGTSRPKRVYAAPASDAWLLRPGP